MTKRIKAFGDSLTRGHYAVGEHLYPYVRRLRFKVFEHYRGKEDQFEFIPSGINGEFSETLVTRLNRELRIEKKQGLKSDCVLLCTGMNDLMFKKDLDPKEVVRNIQEMQRIIESYDIENSVLITVPPSLKDVSSEEFRELKQAVNEGILQLTGSNNLVKINLDLENVYENLELFADESHFSIMGYDWMGDQIFDQGLHDIVKKIGNI